MRSDTIFAARYSASTSESRYTQQNDETVFDLAQDFISDSDFRACHALNNCSHSS
jgi:hypothetical protein